MRILFILSFDLFEKEDNIEDLGLFFISTGKVELFSLHSNSHVKDLNVI